MVVIAAAAWGAAWIGSSAAHLDLDVWYVEHRSVLLDLRIMVRTVAVVLSASGISHGAHATMPEMPDGR